MLPSSWTMHSTFLTPCDLKRAPAARPATLSSWPTCVIAPSDFESVSPELRVMIGMPAALAFFSEPRIASAFGTDTARPSTFWETAASISCASFCGSLLDGLQMSLTPSAWAAAWAPFLTTDQNEPSSLCVTIAKVRPEPWVSWTFFLPLAPEDEEFLLLLLLLDPQAARTRASRSAAKPRPPYIRRLIV